MSSLPKVLPDEWRLVPLGELVEVHDNARKPVKASERVAGPIPYCGANGVIDYVEGYTHEGEFVMLAEDGGYYGPGEPSAYMMSGRFWANNHVHILRGIEGKLLSTFLKHFLVYTDLRPFLTGATRPKLTQSAMLGIPVIIPYPDDPARSLETQRRIVARLDALLAEVAAARRLHAEIVADTARVMEAAIEEVFDQPGNGWQTCYLSDVAFIQTGTAKGRDFRGRKTIELPYLRVANVQAGYLDLSEIKTIEIAEDEVDRYRLQVGDLLLTEGGDFDKLGRGAVWHGEIEPCIHQNHIFAVRLDPTLVQPEFAEYEMLSWHAKRYFLGVAKKTTNLATINRTQLAAFPIKFPDLAEQRRIVARLDAVKQQVAELQAMQKHKQDLLTEVEQAILAQAFRGEL